jgi:hypothetical protein
MKDNTISSGKYLCLKPIAGPQVFPGITDGTQKKPANPETLFPQPRKYFPRTAVIPGEYFHSKQQML